jgi:carbamoyltransferase
MRILGISCFFHDAAAALLEDGVVVAAAEEERFSRRKHDSGFPEHAVAFCLRTAGITAQELDFVVFYEKPLLKFERILLTGLGSFPRSWSGFTEAMVTWLTEKLWIKELIRSKVGVPAERILFTEHHMAHAASAFFCSPWDEAALLTVDGVGEWATTAVGRGLADWSGAGVNRIDLSREIHFPHSLGLLYSAFTAWLGFEVNEGEYKVMGMAPYGTPRYVDRVYEMIDVAEDGGFRLNLEYFSFQHSPDRTFSSRFVDLFGEPRDPAEPFDPSGADAATRERSRYRADVAASVQRVIEETLIKLARSVQRETGSKRLCVAGGVALNSVANGRILRETDFEELYIQPAAGDAGGAVGAALYVWHVILGRPRGYVMEHAYLGAGYTAGEVADFLRGAGVPHETYNDDTRLVERVVDELLEGSVVGWFQGRFEWGPRALGNRSILGDPRRLGMKAIVNEKVKYREPFRPFAPVIPEHRAGDLFVADEALARQYPARFMLLVWPWLDGIADQVPAVNHMGTGRVQTVRREWNPQYYDLVDRFGEATGIPVLLNTSFNLRGEPVVASPADALSTFDRSGLDVLVLGNHIVRKQAGPQLRGVGRPPAPTTR